MAEAAAKVNMLKWALAYARLGWPVFPITWTLRDGSCSCGRDHDPRNTAKHPVGQLAPTGVNSATTDPEVIRSWWTQAPRANIGVACGARSRLLVLDVDPRNGGDETLSRFIVNSPMPNVPEVRTGGGGWHFFFAWPDGVRGSVLSGGIDVKADGGYVIAPPSRHATGVRYAWRRLPKLGEPLPYPPEWVISEHRAAEKREPAIPNRKLGIGERHNYLVRAAGFLRRLGHDPAQINIHLSELNQLWCEPPLAETEIYNLAYSTEGWVPSLPLIAGKVDLTDRGNARRLAALHGDKLKYTAAQGWLVWDGKRWERDVTEKFMQMAQDVAEDVKAELDQEEDEDRRDALRRHYKSSQQTARIDALLKLARSHPTIVARQDEFDADDMLFNVGNGTIDLRTGKLIAASKVDFVTKLSPTFYERTATCPRFLGYLHWAMKNDQEMVDYLQRLFGYCITGKASAQVFPIFWGSGGNGKSTILSTIQQVFGDDYVGKAPEGFLTEKNSEGHPTELADLYGRRLVVAAETGRGKRLNVEQMKTLTGENKIKARFMRQDFFEFRVTFKIIYMTNERPPIRERGNAVWRRVHLVPFLAQVDEAARVEDYASRFVEEYSGILNWIVEGCLRWQQRGLDPPKKVLSATEAYKAETDILGDFINEHLYFDPQAAVSVDNVYQTYAVWSKKAGERYTMSKKALTQELKTRPGFIQKRRMSGMFWVGMGLKGTNITVE